MNNMNIEKVNSNIPLGKQKIADALRTLIMKKDFNLISIKDLTLESGYNETLVYRYFGNKRGLLHYVLEEDVQKLFNQIKFDLKGIKGALNKIRKLVWSTINFYAQNRVFARIILLEVRNYEGYFDSHTYELSRHYSQLLLRIIEEGVENGEIRSNLPASTIRRVILGSIEHLCLPGILFKLEILPDEMTENLCDILFGGIIYKKE